MGLAGLHSLLDDPFDVDRRIDVLEQQFINVKESPYNARGNGVVDDTAAIQAAIDACSAAGGGIVFCPAGIYNVTQLVIKQGVWLCGAGRFAFDSLSIWGTTFRHFTASAVDMFKCQIDANSYVSPSKISGIRLMGHTDSTAGHGIHTLSVDGTVKGRMQDSVEFEDLFILNFKESGIKTYGGSPGRFKDIETLWNGGYGIHVLESDVVSTFGHTHHMSFTNISGDGNAAGATVCIENVPIQKSSIVFTSLKGEQRQNDIHGGVDSQPHVLRIINSGCRIVINGIYHLGSGFSTTKPGDMIRITGATKPSIRWTGAEFRTAPNQIVGPEPNVLSDDGGIAIPKNTWEGGYGDNIDFNYRHITAGRWKYGIPSSSQPAAANPYFEVGGLTPMLGFHESDADANEKLWGVGPSGGDFYIRTINDDGSTGELVVTLSRVGSDVVNALFATTIVPSGADAFSLGSASNYWSSVFSKFIRFVDGGALPAADVSLRGQVRLVQGGAGVADEVYVCRKNAADAYEWRLLT